MRGLIALLFVLLAQPVKAGVGQCDLALSLAIDRSNSIDGQEARQVLTGTAQALAAPGIIDALASGGVWLHIYQFGSGAVNVIPWQRIAGPEDVAQVASILTREIPRPPQAGTSLAAALAYGRAAFEAAPPCGAYVLDVMTDGNPDSGMSEAGRIATAMATFEAGIHQVNVIYVGSDVRMVAFAQQHLTFGFGAFLEVAPTFAEYERAMKRKLLKELAMAIGRKRA